LPECSLQQILTLVHAVVAVYACKSCAPGMPSAYYWHELVLVVACSVEPQSVGAANTCGRRDHYFIKCTKNTSSGLWIFKCTAYQCVETGC
jgi:hypothetical protein